MAGQYKFKDTNGNVVSSISGSNTGVISFSGSLVDFSNTIISGTISNSNTVNGLSSSAFVFTSSFNTISSSVSSQLTTLQTTSGSNIGRLNNLESKSSSVDISISNINNVTSSFSPRVSNLETKSASVDISISNINSFTASNGNTSLNSYTASNDTKFTTLGSYTGSNDTKWTSISNVTSSLIQVTGSYATTGSNTFKGTQIVSASMYVQGDLVVYGSSSIQYISASSVSIGTNIVQLNTNQPAVRFGGLSVQDSGSAVGVTGSMFWDGCCNRWIYSNPSGVGYSGGVIMSGPRASTFGNEPTLTCNYIAKSGGGDHLYDSCIWEMSGSVGINTNSPLALLHLNTSATACDTLKISNGTQSLSLGVNNGAGGSYIFENCGQDFRIGTNNTERIRVMNTGAVCFTCQIYLTNQLIVQDGANSLFTWSSCGNLQPGMFAQSCIGSSYSGLYAKVYGSQVNAGVFGTNTQCVAIVVTEGACNKGLMVGTMSSAPLYMGTSNVVRATIASSGETTFNNIICAPSIIATNCISINTTNPGNYKLYVCNGTATTKVTRIDIGYGTAGVKDFGGLDIFRSNTNGIGDGASITFSGLRADLSDVEYAGYGYVIESCTNSTHAGALSLMTTYAGNARCERVRITGIGNLLLGSSTDYAGILQANGQISAIKSSGYGYIHYTNTTGNNQYFSEQGVSGGFLLSVGKNGTCAQPYLALGTVDSENMRIVSGGNVGFCTTSPATRIGLNSYIGARLPYINGTSNTFDANGITVGNSNNGNTNIGGGIDFTNNCYCIGAYSPILSFSSVSAGYAYNNAYAGIWGVFQGAGGDANWNKGDLAFGTAGAYGIYERMRISNTGLVTKPYQTYFNVRASTNQAVNADAKISYDTIVCSVGGNFNTSTSRFTAPVAGVYVFTLSNSVVSGGIHSYHALYIKINGTSGTDVNYRFRGASNSCNGQWFGIIGTVQVPLATNDYVEIFGYTDTTTMTLQSSETRWQGYLQG